MDDAFEVSWLAPHTWRHVVEVNLETRRAELRLQRPNEAVHDSQPGKISSPFDEAIIVRCEDVKALSRRCTARKTHEKRN
jgi:hypothetical protein